MLFSISRTDCWVLFSQLNFYVRKLMFEGQSGPLLLSEYVHLFEIVVQSHTRSHLRICIQSYIKHTHTEHTIWEVFCNECLFLLNYHYGSQSDRPFVNSMKCVHCVCGTFVVYPFVFGVRENLFLEKLIITKKKETYSVLFYFFSESLCLLWRMLRWYCRLDNTETRRLSSWLRYPESTGISKLCNKRRH